jgi:hypothetical protein
MMRATSLLTHFVFPQNSRMLSDDCGGLWRHSAGIK